MWTIVVKFLFFFIGCELLVHYGHSCLVPITDTVGINLLYVFVNIDMNLSNFVDTLKANFQKEKKLAFVSTIQFVASLQVNMNFFYETL